MKYRQKIIYNPEKSIFTMTHFCVRSNLLKPKAAHIFVELIA